MKKKEWILIYNNIEDVKRFILNQVPLCFHVGATRHTDKTIPYYSVVLDYDAGYSQVTGMENGQYIISDGLRLPDAMSLSIENHPPK